MVSTSGVNSKFFEQDAVYVLILINRKMIITAVQLLIPMELKFKTS